jgi:TolB-like protein/tetratricopeptide (TPR) repeat protein
VATTSTDRLDSWKEIAAHLRRTVRTVQRWEREQGLPIQRHLHHKQGSVYASSTALDAWWASRQPRLEQSEASVPTSIAVLPFADLSPQPGHEYFSEGFAEELSGALTITQVRVVGRASALALERCAPTQIRALGRRLKVTAILEGSIRQTGTRLTVVARLVNLEDGHQVWTGRYDRDVHDVFSIQEDIAQSIVRELPLKRGHMPLAPLVRNRTMNPDAHRFHLRSRHHLSQRTTDGLHKGIDCARRAIGLDGTYAAGYADLAWALLVLRTYGDESPHVSMATAREAASQAIHLDAACDDAYTTLGFIELTYDWNWNAAQASFDRGLTLNSENATAHQGNSLLQLALGRPDAALAEIQIAREIDPLSLIIGTQVGWILYFLRRYDDAIGELHAALELDANFWRGHLNLAWCYIATKEYGKAINALERARALNEYPTLGVIQAGALALAGDRTAAAALLERSCAKGNVTPLYWLAITRLQMGDMDGGYTALRQALERREWFLIFIAREPLLDPVRADARFCDIMQRVGVR